MFTPLDNEPNGRFGFDGMRRSKQSFPNFTFPQVLQEVNNDTHPMTSGNMGITPSKYPILPRRSATQL